MAYEERLTGDNDAADRPVIIWAHGWGQNRDAFKLIAEAFATQFDHIFVDFPGFGDSPAPHDKIENSWGSEDYAAAMHEFITQHLNGRQVIYIGHSFGCRVALQLGARWPDLVHKMIFIGGAGLKRQRSALQKALLALKVYRYKALKWIYFRPLVQALLKAVYGGKLPEFKAGSRDYQNAGAMKGTLVKVVNEDLLPKAERIRCPVLLIYGENDRETPPEFGKRFCERIEKSQLMVLADQDHYSVLTGGRHGVNIGIKNFLN